MLVSCNCERTQAQVKCGTDLECDRICDRILPCENHYCEMKCHKDECDKCEETNNLRCKCAKVEMEVECGETNDWSCDQVCSKLKDCRNHECLKLCHSGDCDSCVLLPEAATTCPCGKEEIDISSVQTMSVIIRLNLRRM